MDAVSVLSTPARPQYLPNTLARLDAAGATRAGLRVVFMDGKPARLRAWGTLVQWGAPIGARRSMWWVFRRMIDWRVDRLLYCEDDILPATDAVTRIFATEVREDQALVSFFDRKEFPGAARAQPGVHDVPIMGLDRKGLFGACALLLPRRTIEWALRSDPEDPAMPVHADQALSWALRDSPWKLRGVHIPSLIEHIGDVSSMSHAAGQRAALFGP